MASITALCCEYVAGINADSKPVAEGGALQDCCKLLEGASNGGPLACYGFKQDSDIVACAASLKEPVQVSYDSFNAGISPFAPVASRMDDNPRDGKEMTAAELICQGLHRLVRKLLFPCGKIYEIGCMGGEVG